MKAERYADGSLAWGSPAWKAQQTKQRSSEARAKVAREQNAAYKALMESGAWPADTCPNCIRRGVPNIGAAGCCKSYSHHIGSVCLHCGNDERGRDWKFRGVS